MFNNTRLLPMITVLLCTGLVAGCGDQPEPGTTDQADGNTAQSEQSRTGHSQPSGDRQTRNTNEGQAQTQNQGKNPSDGTDQLTVVERIPRVTIPYSKFVLDNGLTLIVHEDHDTPIVAVNMWYHVGSKNEGPDQHGFAHLFEHLMFQGTEHWEGEYFAPFERAGATNMNGTTNKDRTTYFANVPSTALDMALWMESDRMGHFLGAITEEVLIEQTHVVINEMKQSANKPYGEVWRILPANTYPADHPYSWPTIGSIEDLKAATLEDVRSWFKKYYNPTNATLVLAGDVDTRTALKKVKKYFGWIPAGPPLNKQKKRPAPMEGVHRQVMYDRVPHARIYKVWNIPGAGTKAETRLSLVAELLAGSKASPLYKRLVLESKLATSVTAGIISKEIGSQFLIAATARDGVPLAKVEQAIAEELHAFLKHGPTEEELRRAKVEKLASFVRAAQEVGGFGGKSSILARGEVFHNNPAHYKKYLHTIRNAQPEAVTAAARKWLTKGRYVLEVHPFGEHSSERPDVDRSHIPEVGEGTDLDLPDIRKATLDNGMKIWLAQVDGSPMVAVRMVLDAGYAADPADMPGLASMTLSMLDEGTEHLSTLEISTTLARLGASVSTSSSLDASVISLSALRSLLGQSLEIYTEIIRNPAFPKEALHRLKKLRLAAIAQEKSSPVAMALRALGPLLYPEGHDYSVPLTGTGTVSAVKAMDVADIKGFYNTWVRPDNATLIVVGDIDMATLKPMLKKHFGGWEPPDEPLPQKHIPRVEPREQSRIFLIHRSGSTQATVIAGNLAPPKSSPMNIEMTTANTILGGMFNSRLNLNLREDKHWSYGAGSALSDARAQQPFFAYASVQINKTAESMREIHQELYGIVHGNPPTMDELNLAQAHLTRSLPGKNETVGDLASTFVQSAVFNLPADYYEQYISKVRSLGLEEVAEGADVMIDPGALTWVVVGNLGKIEAPIRALEFGEVHIISPGSDDESVHAE